MYVNACEDNESAELSQIFLHAYVRLMRQHSIHKKLFETLLHAHALTGFVVFAD